MVVRLESRFNFFAQKYIYLNEGIMQMLSCVWQTNSKCILESLLVQTLKQFYDFLRKVCILTPSKVLLNLFGPGICWQLHLTSIQCYDSRHPFTARIDPDNRHEYA